MDNSLKPQTNPGAVAGANRREFLRGSVRYTALAGLALLAARVLGRRDGSGCTNPPGCGACPVFTDCRLPQALANKPLQ